MSLRIDRTSLLVEVDGESTLGTCEAALRAEGLTLDVALGERHATTIADWIAEGLPGTRDPWRDPADHAIAGLDATLPSGAALTIRPAPRRAVGPDLIALVVGMHHRYARVTRAWLRVHPEGVPRPETAPFNGDRSPTVTPEESALFDAIDAALRG